MGVRQHYVPQFYLRNFGTGLYSYDKKNSTISHTTVDNICVEKFFYCKPNNEGPDFETFLSKLETDFANTLRQVVEKKNLHEMDQKTRDFLILFVASQLIRTKEKRIMLEQLISNISDLFVEEHGIADWHLELSSEVVRAFHCSELMTNVDSYSSIISSKLKMILFRNKTRMPLWTSDNPVFLHNDIMSQHYGTHGLACKGIQIHLPLSPKLLLLFVDRDVYTEIPDDYLDDILNVENIRFENSLQLSKSTRFVFSAYKDFGMADRYLAQYPEFRNVDRPRLSSSLDTLHTLPSSEDNS